MDYSKSMGNNPKYNTFDLSHDKRLSLKMGEVIPVMAMDVLPGDKFTIDTSYLTRFLPLVAPVMHNVKVKVRYFFSPNRLVWDDWEDFITGPESATDTTEPTHPYLNIPSAPSSLADYLGVSTSTGGNQTVEVNALPFAHYHFIWEEYFRDQNLQNPTNNWKLLGGAVTGSQKNALQNTKPVAWQHDRFTSALPFTQKGPEVTLPSVTNDINVQFAWATTDLVKSSTGNQAGGLGLQTETGGYLTAVDLAGNKVGASIDNSSNLYVPKASFNATVNELREAFAIQKWLELNARTGNRYVEHIQAHFGVKPQDARLQRPEEFGGSVSTIQFSEVLQQSQSTTSGNDASPLGTMGGHALTASGSRKSSYYAQEHGWVFAFMYIVPDTAYFQGVPAKFSKTDRYDYFQPLLAHIGEQPVLKKELYADGGTQDDQTFGYLPIYDEYRHEQNTVHGLLKKDQSQGGLDFWHLGRKFATRPQLNDSFIECNPSNRIFTTINDDEQIIAHVYNKTIVQRKVPYYGTPMGI